MLSFVASFNEDFLIRETETMFFTSILFKIYTRVNEI